MENANWFYSSYLKYKMENGILHFKWVYEMDSFEIVAQLWVLPKLYACHES